jgi:hypothetical protein
VSRRLLVYPLLALPIAAAAVVLLLTGNKSPPARTAGATAYLERMRQLCESADRVAAGDPTLPPHFEGLGAYVARRLLRARSFERQLVTVQAPAIASHYQAGLLAAARDEVGTLGRLRPAVAHHDATETDALIAHFQALNERRNLPAAWLGLPGCIRVQGADPRLAYPPAPRRGGRSLLSRSGFARALRGICADSAARSDYGKQLIDTFPATDRQRGEARSRFTREIRLRLGSLIRRLGARPGSGGSPLLDSLGCVASS